ncbi:MAG: hypothetical protein AAFU49_22395 [Pseudomonadota bacterium]
MTAQWTAEDFLDSAPVSPPQISMECSHKGQYFTTKINRRLPMSRNSGEEMTIEVSGTFTLKGMRGSGVDDDVIRKFVAEAMLDYQKRVNTKLKTWLSGALSKIDKINKAAQTEIRKIEKAKHKLGPEGVERGFARVNYKRQTGMEALDSSLTASLAELVRSCVNAAYAAMFKKYGK